MHESHTRDHATRGNFLLVIEFMTGELREFEEGRARIQ
jgi:hypothetical protein